MKLECLRIARLFVPLATVCTALGGCMTSTPVWDAHFGEAVRTNTQAQIIDPHASEHNPSTQGVDGQSAVSAMTQYDKLFSAPPVSSNPYTIGVSSGMGGGISGGQ
ncbi:MAG TPA: hypothetical protein VG320_30950 [Paraburkholderia sp.]|jgi:hypothetical protein|uniref:hypothetical protein n=1 Tax=Paraburkholderia sp. TaxID=1926495 RepID=UPI002DE34D84|nr:hypothetical protein [Paraburkholderia sp.]